MCTGTRALYPSIKQPGCEAKHSSPSSAKVKTERINNSTHWHASMAWSGESWLYSRCHDQKKNTGSIPMLYL